MASTSGPPPSQEFTVRVPKNIKKTYGIMKFNPNTKMDFTKTNGVKIERENNLKDYKAANNLETMPKFGAGSEFGRDQKEEARRKKYGYYRKSYCVEDQPWVLKTGSGKTARSFKGTKEGGILDNTSYYIFTQCPDGAFEAFPIEEWHNFHPKINYKHLSAEEAEEQYSKREKILNYHTIMVHKRFQDEQESSVAEDDQDKKKKKPKKKGKDFFLTEIDEWAELSDESGDDDSDSEAIKSLKNRSTKKKPSKKSGKKHNSDDEAVEESDEADEGREVDYMTDTDSEDEDPFADKDREQADKYKEKGVEDEEGLVKLIESEDEEEAAKPENEDEEAEKEGKEKSGSDSESSSSSDSDADPEKEGTFNSALFMPYLTSTNLEQQIKDESEKKDKNKKDKSKKALKRKGSFSSEGSNSRGPTPPTLNPVQAAILSAKKAQAQESSSAPPIKKQKIDTKGIEGLNEESVKRYLMRKPMTIKDLLQKFKKEGLPKEKLVPTLTEILRRIKPEKTKIKDVLYLSIKQ